MIDERPPIQSPLRVASTELPWRATLLVFVALLNGCSDNVGPWKEEVKLSDGRVIVVERRESFDVTNPMGDVGTAFLRKARIRIVAPAELTALPELVMRYRPVILDYDPTDGIWFAVGVNDNACGNEAFNSGHMNSRGTINLRPNLEFRIVNGVWEPVELGPERLGLPANLLIMRSTIDQFEVMPLAEKARLDADTGLPEEFLQVMPHIGCR